ncbi:helix-turn-helix transcriptional regulator [Kitasatospora sp. NPDC058162]|uniref:helix-turn-helix transcriptional regulator n=1 Tax=Kitasatospora sp. NPDC058162 TaxID=3346362 RepID=UPI0036DBB6C9
MDIPGIAAPAVPDDTWLTCDETSKLTKLSPKTLANWRARGIGPAYIKLSPGKAGRVRYSASAVKAWLTERGVRAA